jgi:hypothetical protein
MKRIVIASVVMMLLFALAAQAQTPPPGPEHKKLGVWLGTWTGEGKTEATPFSKAGTSKRTLTCSWFTGGYQVVCEGQVTGTTGKSEIRYVHGYSVAKKQYFTFGMSSTGMFDMVPGRVDGSDWTWTWEGSPTSGGKPYQFRLVVKTSPNGNTGRNEYSEDGKSWELISEVKSVKK